MATANSTVAIRNGKGFVPGRPSGNRPGQEIAQNYCCRLAVYDPLHFLSLDPGSPQTATGLVGGRTLALQVDRKVERKREFPGHFAGLGGHFTLAAVEVIRQTNNKSDGIIFPKNVSDLQQEFFPRRSLDNTQRAGGYAKFVADGNTYSLRSGIESHDPTFGRHARNICKIT